MSQRLGIFHLAPYFHPLTLSLIGSTRHESSQIIIRISILEDIPRLPSLVPICHFLALFGFLQGKKLHTSFSRKNWRRRVVVALSQGARLVRVIAFLDSVVD